MLSFNSVFLLFLFSISGLAHAANGFVRQKHIPMIMTWDTRNTDGSSSAANQIRLPLVAGSNYNFRVDWGDGTQSLITSWNDTDATHTYATDGVKTVQFLGSFQRIYFNNSGDRLKILDISQWGSNKYTSMANAFSGCENLNISASDSPDLNNVTDISLVFNRAYALNVTLNWNTSKVVNMTGAFQYATSFNQPLNWDTTSATNISYMFFGATSFNQPLNWNTTNVTNMSVIFYGATAFNGDINSWVTSNVTNMSSAFSGASSFNKPLNNWITSNVTNMAGMFNGAAAFNQDISSWNTSKVTLMTWMFQDAVNFNQNISSWDVSKVIDMKYTFNYARSFNQNISSWRTTSATDMTMMFYRAEAFNQNLSSWCVSSMATEPTNFRSFTPGWTLPQPIWGTCPP